MSRFDIKVGPKLFLNVPELPPQKNLVHIPLLMDFYEEGFFIHEFGELKTSNLIFSIPSPITRGDQENLMISIVFLEEKEEDPKIFQGLLEEFVYELKEIQDVYKGFYKEEEKFEESHQIYTKIVNLLNTVHNSFPKEIVFMKSRDINLVLFDFIKEGDSQIAAILKDLIFNGEFYKEKSEESNLLYNKISISDYSISISNRLFFNNFLLFQLKNKDGFIFVVDETNGLIKHAVEILNLISKSPNLAPIPSLILFNEIATDRIEIQRLIEKLSINEDDNKIIKFIPFDASDKDEMIEAINWIVDRITVKKVPIIT